MGKDVEIKDNPVQRWRKMGFVAIGQSKMVARPLAAVLHIIVYVGFFVVNVEMLEILIDGITGSHRALSFIGNLYPFFISVFESFAFAVIIACLIFLARRNIIKLKRFWNKEMTSWPRTDANIILITEVLLMCSVLVMNASDSILQSRGYTHYSAVGNFFVSDFIKPVLVGMNSDSLASLERFTWWFHIVGVFIFLNYIPYSKHLHVFLSFPNVYYSKLGPKTQIQPLDSITREVSLMLNPEMEISATYVEGAEMELFGAKDTPDFTWKNLMDAFTCTECGRCTSSCPASITGKKLSPRKLMMDLRDRTEELEKIGIKSKKECEDGKTLFDRITPEEIWACTTCNACVQECPVNIDPVSIVLELRRYLCLEKSAAPRDLNIMFTNIENNGAPWQFSSEDSLKWATDAGIDVPLMANLFSNGKKPEYLFWVGSSGAFDDRFKKVSVCHDNALTLNYLQGINDKRIFLLDRSSKGNGWIGKRHGVGWARKTAMDFACTMAGNTDIILTLDADTHYPSNYFDSVINALESYPDATGLQAPYYHNLTGNEQADRAILRYEIYMRSYAINLMAIRNPYCFSAIGSGMACSVEVYKRVGGLTPKMSGEDFYFIQKLRKAGRIIINCETVVNPAARFSDRVYFGTGPAMIRGKDGNWDSYPIYSMESFKKIADTYTLFPLLYEKDIPVALDEFLLQWSGGSSFWEPLRLNSSNVDAFVKACMQRFDGLRILQFLKADNKNYKTTDEEKLKELLGSKLFSDIEKPDVSNVKDFEKLSVDEMNMLRDLLTEKERKLQRHIKLA